MTPLAEETAVLVASTEGDGDDLVDLAPRGVATSTLSPLPLPINARAKVEVTENLPV